MAKTKATYVCTDCGSEYSRWLGQCTDCKAWNTISEFKQAKLPARGGNFAGFAGAAHNEQAKVQTLDNIDLTDLPRFSSGFLEFDRVLGGGIVPGSAILIGGEPGAWKSTLLLQTMCSLANTMPALYITGEESLQQVAMRAKRLDLPTNKLKMLSETSVENICHIAIK
jgi:DNA repair protein RadA/Sms